MVDGDEYQVIVDWDEKVGRSLHLIPGVDRYHVLDPSDTAEMEQSWMNLAAIQSKLTDDLDSRCPRCGKLFDCKRGAISRRVI